MIGGEDPMMRPVLRGALRYEAVGVGPLGDVLAADSAGTPT